MLASKGKGTGYESVDALCFNGLTVKPLCLFSSSLSAFLAVRSEEPDRQPVLVDFVFHIIGVLALIRALAEIRVFGCIIGQLATENRVVGCDVHTVVTLIVEDNRFLLVFI